MKISSFLFVLLLLSFSTLLPLTNPTYELDIIPNTPTSVILNISNPQITFSSGTGSLVEMNVSRLDYSENSTMLITSTQFSNTVELKIDESGFYLFEFFSLSLDTIRFDFQGLFPLNIIILIFGVLVNSGFWIYYYYKEYWN